MATKDKYGRRRTIPFRRKLEGKTNYIKRLALLKSGRSRLVLRKSLNTVIAQVVEYKPQGDSILISATSKELKKFGWKGHTGNIPSAYLTGFLIGTKANKMKIKDAIVDTGLRAPIRGGRVFAAMKGALDAGMELNCGQEAFPKPDRISGKHIADYASKIKNDAQKYQKQFSRYIKDGMKPEELPKLFEETKKKILSS